MIFIFYFVSLDAGKQFEVITSSSADVYKQEQVRLFVVFNSVTNPNPKYKIYTTLLFLSQMLLNFKIF